MALSLQHYTESDMNDITQKILKERMGKERKRSMFIASEMVRDLSPGLIIEILSWLPVITLLRFKCVCKLWYSIISSPHFISKHLRNYYNNNDSWRHCLLVHYYITNSELDLYALLLDDIPRVLSTIEIDNIHPIHDRFYVCGPCNGIYYRYYYNERQRALWNPATNELKHLPDIICKPHLPSNITCAPLDEGYGFGLDPLTGDYKVIVIKDYWSTDDDDDNVVYPLHPLSVLVYSLRTNCWRYCGDLARARRLEDNRCYMYVDGCYFWFGSSYNNHSSKVIVSFDMANDAFKEMDVPDYSEPSSMCLGVYDDSLAFLSLDVTQKVLDIWTWKQGSWNKKFRTNPLPADISRPIGHWKDNHILLEDDCKLVLIDPASQELKDLGFQMHLSCQGVFADMESLVSLKDVSNLEQQIEEIEAKFNYL